MEVFCKNLRRLRLGKGYTQEQLAEALGVSPQTVSRWECGTTLPDVMQLPKLARLYGITVDDLYRQEVNAYANYAQRLLAVYEATRRTEDFLAAEQEYLRLLAKEHTADDLRSMGVLYHYMVRYCAPRAEQYLNAALEKADRNDWVWSGSAQQKLALLCDLGRGKEEAARQAEALEQHPEDAKAWLLCIAAHHYAGLHEKAYELAMEGIRRFPEEPIILCHAGDICQALKRYEEAFTYWKRVQALNGDVYDAVFSMAFCYEELGQYDKAYGIWTDLHRRLLSQGYALECRLPAERAKLCKDKM